MSSELTRFARSRASRRSRSRWPAFGYVGADRRHADRSARGGPVYWIVLPWAGRVSSSTGEAARGAGRRFGSHLVAVNTLSSAAACRATSDYVIAVGRGVSSPVGGALAILPHTQPLGLYRPARSLDPPNLVAVLAISTVLLPHGVRGSSPPTPRARPAARARWAQPFITAKQLRGRRSTAPMANRALPHLLAEPRPPLRWRRPVRQRWIDVGGRSCPFDLPVARSCFRVVQRTGDLDQGASGRP
jgi:hypothetical protein